MLRLQKSEFKSSDFRKMKKQIGLVLKKLFDDGVVKREELFITSKLWCTDHDPQDVSEALDKTLHDLQLDYVDLYLVVLLIGKEALDSDIVPMILETKDRRELAKYTSLPASPHF